MSESRTENRKWTAGSGRGRRGRRLRGRKLGASLGTRRSSSAPSCGSATPGLTATWAAAGGYGYRGGFGSYSAVGVEVGDPQGAVEELLDQLIGEVAGEAKTLRSSARSSTGPLPRHAGAVVPGDCLVCSRGHAGLRHSQQCVHNAPCPVGRVPAKGNSK